MSAMLPAIVIVAIIAGVLIGLLGRYWAIRRGDVDTPREAGKVAWRWGLNGAYAFTVGGVVPSNKRPSENVSDGLFAWGKA